MFFPKMDHKFEKLEQFTVFLQKTPVQPGHLIVLTIGIVVAELCVPEFIACQKHRRSPAAHQYRTGIADHPITKHLYFRIVGLPLRSAVPAPVVACAVGIVPSIGFIVFRIVRIQIVQRESIVTSQKIHTGIVARIPFVAVLRVSAVQISRSGYTPRRSPRLPEIAFQVTAQTIPVSSVPLCPAPVCRKLSDLIHAAGIPCFRDQLYITQNRIERQTFQKRRIVHRRTVRISPEDACQIKPESVDPVVDRPILQTFQDHLPHHRMVAVQSIAAAAEIVIVPIRRQHIINLIVKSFETKCGTFFISLRGVIEHNVQDHFDPILMQLPDQRF